jgi:hypothetical protein
VHAPEETAVNRSVHQLGDPYPFGADFDSSATL